MNLVIQLWRWLWKPGSIHKLSVFVLTIASVAIAILGFRLMYYSFGMEPPSFILSSPQLDSMVGETATVSGLVSGGPYDWFVLKLAGDEIGRSLPASVDTGDLSDGTHQLTIEFWHRGRLSKTISYDISIDNSPPEIRVTGVEDGDVCSGLMDFEFSSWDDMSETISEVMLDGVSRLSSGVLDASELSEGVHFLLFSSTDVAGNHASHSVSFTVDHTPPNLEALNSLSSKRISGLLDLSSLAPDLRTSEITVEIEGHGPWTGCIINTCELPDGTYEVAVSAVDKPLNSSSLRFRLHIDNTPPVVYWVLPNDKLIEWGGERELAFFAYCLDLLPPAYYIDGSLVEEPYLPADYLMLGQSAELVVVCTDAAGNSTRLETTILRVSESSAAVAGLRLGIAGLARILLLPPMALLHAASSVSDIFGMEVPLLANPSAGSFHLKLISRSSFAASIILGSYRDTIADEGFAFGFEYPIGVAFQVPIRGPMPLEQGSSWNLDAEIGTAYLGGRMQLLESEEIDVEALSLGTANTKTWLGVLATWQGALFGENSARSFAPFFCVTAGLRLSNFSSETWEFHEEDAGSDSRSEEEEETYWRTYHSSSSEWTLRPTISFFLGLTELLRGVEDLLLLLLSGRAVFLNADANCGPVTLHMN